MANISTLVDTFSATSFAAHWTDVYGGAVLDQVSGRAQIPTTHTGGTINYAGIHTASAHLLDDLFVEVFPQPLSGAAGTCFTNVGVEHPTIAGTRVVIALDVVAGVLEFANQVGYAEAGAPSVTYSATNHAWWRMRTSGANLLWQTAPDGLVWTTRRTITAPSWLATSGQSVRLEGFRNSGTASNAFFDNQNAPPAAASGDTTGFLALLAS